MHLQQLGTIEATLKSNSVDAFRNDGEHHYSIKEIKPDYKCLHLLTANVQFDNKFEGFEESYKDGAVLFIGLKSASQVITEYTIYHRGRTIDGTLQNDSTTEQFVYNTVKPRSEKNNRKHIHSLNENIHKNEISVCDTYVTIREIGEAIKGQVSIPYIMPIRFRLSIPLDDILVFSGFTDYPNSLFGDLKIKFKINPNAFVFAQMNPLISIAKYYTMNKINLLASGPEKLKNIDLLFKKLEVEAQSFPTSATTIGIRTSQNIPLSHVTDLCLLFSKDARATTCFENPCYHNMQVTTCGRNFPDMPMNALDQQFFQMQFNASNLDMLFEAIDEFEDALTIPRNTASRRLNSHTDLTSFMITLQCERNSNGALTFDRFDSQNQNVSVQL
ncbi:MAG: hypothetical protein EZS28_000655 [Streblomastix strix]|uniref:Uncharacterized protein n=1 Tax=Streblomastix strix TaxID=222440 RepID=A0A5J4X9R4_9EUKA|nr:MAG: hypothetical protein EZS28_000655 [Streblomastix strix]